VRTKDFVLQQGQFLRVLRFEVDKVQVTRSAAQSSTWVVHDEPSQESKARLVQAWNICDELIDTYSQHKEPRGCTGIAIGNEVRETTWHLLFFMAFQNKLALMTYEEELEKGRIIDKLKPVCVVPPQILSPGIDISLRLKKAELTGHSITDVFGSDPAKYKPEVQISDEEISDDDTEYADPSPKLSPKSSSQKNRKQSTKQAAQKRGARSSEQRPSKESLGEQGSDIPDEDVAVVTAVSSTYTELPDYEGKEPPARADCMGNKPDRSYCKCLM